MYIFSARNKWRKAVAFPLTYDQIRTEGILFLFLFLGVFAGGIYASYATSGFLPLASVFWINADAPNRVWTVIWRESKYFLFLLVSSTTYLGQMLVPALLLLRGFVLGAVPAASFTAHGYYGLLYAAACCGLPAALTMPFLMLLAKDGFLRSRSLLFYRLGLHSAAEISNVLVRHMVFCAAALAADTVYCCLILPHLLP